MTINLTTKQHATLFESLHRYKTRLELDAAALARLDESRANKLLKECDAVEALIQHLRQY